MCRRSQRTCKHKKTRCAHVWSNILSEKSWTAYSDGDLWRGGNSKSTIRSSRQPIQGDFNSCLWSWTYRWRSFASSYVHGRNQWRNRFARQVKNSKIAVAQWWCMTPHRKSWDVVLEDKSSESANILYHV